MKKLRLIILAVFIGALGTATTLAQAKYWRIVNGPGAGTILLAEGGIFVSDDLWDAEGTIAPPDECDCVHYHGVLYGKPDPNPHGCGWGCVIEMPTTPVAARTAVQQAIDNIDLFDPALANKLDSILNTAADAVNKDCNTLFQGAVNAMGDEVLGAISNQPTNAPRFDSFLQKIADYVALALSAMNLPDNPTNEPPCCKVTLLRRHGSAAQAKLFDAKRKINADLGEVIALDAQSCPDGGPFMWEYKFKGQKAGDVPSGSGISFTTERFCVLSERPTTVTVTVSFICPSGKEVKDTVTINIQ